MDVLSAHRILQSRLPAEPGIENCHWVEPPERLQFYIQVGKDSLESKELFNRHHIRLNCVTETCYNMFYYLPVRGGIFCIKMLKKELTLI